MTVSSRNDSRSPVMTILAKALYDNLADAPDELSFRKGDIVTVIEQDVDGLVGWWLCLLHGRQGIVPGNRLQVIPGFESGHSPTTNEHYGKYDRGVDYDTLPTPVKASHGEIYDSPVPLSVKDLYNFPIHQNNDIAAKFNQMKFSSPRSVAEETANVMTANSSRSHGDLLPQEMYDSLPNKSFIDQSDYDVPVAKQESAPRNYLPEGIYDQFPKPVGKPLSPRQLLSEDIYKMPSAFHGLRDDPIVSKAVTDPMSGGSLHYRQPHNTAPDQATGTKASSPKTEDIYVVPVNRHNGTPPKVEDIYVTPVNRHPTVAIKTEDIYVAPVTRPNGVAAPSKDIYKVPQGQQDIYDVLPPVGFRNEPEIMREQIHAVNAPQQEKNTSSSDNAVHSPSAFAGMNGGQDVVNNNVSSDSQYAEDDYMDYQDIYGAEPPPGMTKSPLSSRSASPTQQLGKETKKNVLEQINMEAVRELHITQTCAFDRLGKLHLAVDTSVLTLLGFAEDDWLEPLLLRENIASIRDLSNKCKTALRLLTEFGLGCLVNVRKRRSKAKLEEKIITGLEPLLECYYKIKICLLHLDNLDWLVPAVREASTEKFFATINAIVILSQRIPDMCSSFAATVHLNVGYLFDREPRKASTAEVGPVPMSPQITPPSPSLPVLNSNASDAVQPTYDDLVSVQQSNRRRLSSDSTGLATSGLAPSTLRRRTQSRKKSMEEVASQTLKPRVPPKPSLPDQRKSMSNFLPGRLEDDLPADEGLVTDFVPESPRRKCASDPMSSPTAQDGEKTMWGGSCPSLERKKNSQGSSERDAPPPPADVTANQRQRHDSTSGNDNVMALAGKQASDPNLLASSLQGTLHMRSSSLPHDDRKTVFPSYKKEQVASPSKCDAPRMPRLDHRDIETLDFFCRQVESQVIILREAVRNLTESVENLDPPKKFVSHSKFVILTAHKVVHAGDESNERVMNQLVKKKLKQCVLDLTASIRSVVASTKQAALQYPNRACLSEMASCILNVGESVRGLHIEIRKALQM